MFSAFGNQSRRLVIKRFYAALTILPDLMQRVQTFIRPFPPLGS